MRRYSVLFLLLFLSTTLFSKGPIKQNASRISIGYVAIGGKILLGLSSIINTKDFNLLRKSMDTKKMPLFSYSASFMTEIYFDNKYSFQPEIGYNRSGTYLKSSQNIGTVGGILNSMSTITRLHVINIALNNIIWIDNNWFFECGPEINLYANAVSSIATKNSSYAKKDLSKTTSLFGLSLFSGFGYSFKFGLELSARATFGVLNINNASLTNDVGDVIFKNEFFQTRPFNIMLGVAYKFAVHKRLSHKR